MKPEAKILKEIKVYLRTLGHVTRVSASDSNGEPDLIACVKGKYVAVEAKAENGIPSEIQLVKLKRIRLAGGIAIIAKSVEEVSSALKEHGLI